MPQTYPTIKQKMAFKEVVMGSSISKAMEKVGYSKSTAKRTNKITQTKGWKELVEEFLPDSDLARLHKEGLNAGRTIYKNNMTSGEIEEVGFEPDYAVRHKYLDSAYKLKDRFPKDEHKTIVFSGNRITFTKFNGKEIEPSSE
jgi:transposase